MGIKAKILKELQKKPRRLKELKAKLGNDKKVARAVDELVERNKVVCRKGVYAVPDPKTGNAVECTLVKLAGKFGFARPVQPDGQDIFIPGKYLMGAMPGDTLLVSLFEHPRVEGSSEGEVLAVVKENNRFTGTVETIEGRLALVPDACPHCPIYIKKSADGGARDGEKAAVEILERGDSHEDHRAGVAMRFGSAEEAKQCAKALLYGAGLSRHFPLKAKAEAKKYEGAAVGEKEAAGRRDYRGMPVFTIDSAETKDIDDAISLEKTDTGYRLGVHIADVSHYVRPGSALDAETFARGTSVYYADSVIPMLPRQLSNGICSLNEGADRLAFSCMMELDAAGRVVDYAFVKSVIRSRVKGVYKEVNAIFDGTADNALRQRYAAVAQELPQSHQGERAARIASKTADGTLRNDPWWLWAGVSFVGVYSGYFGAAAGTLALAILDLGKIGPFHQINALKTVVGFGANISAAIMFICRGSVYWPFAIAMCLGCIIGSSIAPPVTRHIPENIMRAAAVLTGIVLAVKLGCSTYF